MWFSSFLLLGAFSGVLGQLGPEFEPCLRRLMRLDSERLERGSGEVQLQRICPVVLKAFRCIDRKLQATFSRSMEEVVDLIISQGTVDEEGGKSLRVSANMKTMITDLCTDGTQLNQDVKADVNCFETIDKKEAVKGCRAKAAAHGFFTNTSRDTGNIDTKRKLWDFIHDGNCQESAFMASCFSLSVREECGQRAFSTFNTILKRTTIFPNKVCSNGKLEETRAAVDRSDMPEAEKNLYRQALDL